MTVNARYTGNGVLSFENPCPYGSPSFEGAGTVITIRTPGTAGGCYTDFLVIAVDGEDRLAVEVGSAAYNDFMAGRFSFPVGR
jgi:hypothetical protein